MYCNNCGKEIKDDATFCNNCGNKVVQEENDSYIIFERKEQFYGVLVPINIYLDGKQVASLKSNETKKVLTNVGNHRIAFNLWSGNGQYDINITKENRNVKVVFKLSMGLVTSKPKIISIENI